MASRVPLYPTIHRIKMHQSIILLAFEIDNSVRAQSPSWSIFMTVSVLACLHRSTASQSSCKCSVQMIKIQDLPLHGDLFLSRRGKASTVINILHEKKAWKAYVEEEVR
ncbi:hypothetical protein SAY86_009197 [Trapa natans]|uniref:Uncharacterized protein n=1 Tax=Trapa natans TaxID=22666 RepID=A0AAN7L4F1_TRANT|nr:hypothetical protein SAY86_009197 [Trapa natans]